jgi:hypothetical protein
MSDDLSLDDVLNGTEETETQVEAEAEASETETDETKGEAETEEAQATEEEAQESTPDSKAQDDDEKSWTKTAYLDEKAKRQERDAQIEQLSQKLKELEEKGQEASKTDFYDDPDKALAEVEAKNQGELRALKLEMSEELMRSLHTDYDELRAEFIELAKDNPVIRQEFNKASNMAKYAYETAQKARQANELKNPEALREKLRAELREELRNELKAELETSQAKQQEKDSALMPSLASKQSKGDMNDSPEESLDDILS